MYPIFFLLIFLLPISSVSGNKSPHVQSEMTYEKLLHQALAQRTILDASYEKIRAQKYAERSIFANYLPHMFLNADTVKNVDNILPRQQTSLELSQTIFDLPTIQAYRAAQQMSLITLLEQQQLGLQVQFELEETMIRFWQEQEKSSYIRAEQKTSPIIFSRSLYQYDYGLIDLLQLVSTEKNYVSSMVAVDTYPDESAAAHAQLQHATETPHEIKIDTTQVRHWIDQSLSSFERTSLETYLALALQSRPELQILEAQRASFSLQASQERAAYLPKIRAFGDVTHNTLLAFFAETLEPDIEKTPTYWAFGLRILWEFDGFSRAYRAEEFHAQALETFFQQQNIAHTIKKEVEVGYADAQIAIKTIADTQERYRELCTELQMNEIAYAAGLTTLIDLQEMMVNVEEAYYDVLQQKSEAARATRKLLYQCGYSLNSSGNHDS